MINLRRKSGEPVEVEHVYHFEDGSTEVETVQPDSGSSTGDEGLGGTHRTSLATLLTEAGLAVLRLDALRALTGVYPGVDREDEMVAAFDFCAFGKGGAAPSIDTAMHGLVDAPHAAAALVAQQQRAEQGVGEQ